MRLSVVFLALFALAAAIPTTPKIHAADQELLKKQQDVIHLLENIVGELPHQHLYEMAMGWEFEPNLQNYENPSVVKYYVGLVKTGHVQPKHTPFSASISVLRKEIALLTQIFLGAKDYQTFLATAAWARVHVNQEQFVKAFTSAVLQRHDMHGVILPPVYEVFPHYFFDSRIIQKVHDYVHRHGIEHVTQNQNEPHVHWVHVNYTSHLPPGEHQLAYFTDDIGLSAYYYYVHMSSYMMPHTHHSTHKYSAGAFHQEGQDMAQHKIGHGAHFYYLHQQLLARYNLERLSQGLGPIKALDDYYEHIETPFDPHMNFLNGMHMPGRGEHIYVTAKHHHYELIKMVRALEQRIIDAIDLGHVITPQGVFLSLYQPQGLNILGELIEGTGRSINPRYYGSYQAVAKQLFGNAPAFQHIWEYTPSALELGQTAIHDPIFWQLFSKILEFFHYYQEALPAYQYNDLVVPGVHVVKVDVGELVTYFSDYEVDLSNAVPQPVDPQHHHEQQPFPHVKAHLKRLDHKPYEYTIHVEAQKPVPGAVVRVYVGPKYNHNGQPIDINLHRHYFFEIDQFLYDINEGHNVIVRNSHQATGQSYDWPSVQMIKDRVGGAIRSQNPYYIIEPQQLFGFPARLSLPKGWTSGMPLYWFVVITAGVHHQPEHYGPVVEDEWMTYQPQHYQVVMPEEYQQFGRLPIDKVHGGAMTVEVMPDWDAQVVTEGNWHWGYLYKKWPGSYYYPHWNQVHYSTHGQGHQTDSHFEMNQQQQQQQHEVHAGEEWQGQKHGVNGGYGWGEQLGGKVPHVYHHPSEHSTEGGSKGWQTHYVQGMYHGVHAPDHEYHGSGHYPGASELHGTYPAGTYKGWQGHEEHLQHHYENEHIGNVIGGAVSLDGKPLGYPFDRPLAHGAFGVPNIYIKDVLVHHVDEFIPEY